MNQATGTVVSIDGDCGERYALVEVAASTLCRRCAAGKGCGAGLTAKRRPVRRIVVAVPASANIGPGDSVRLLMKPRDLLSASVLVYGWPLAGALLAALLAWNLEASDGAAALAALTGVGVGAWLVRLKIRGEACLERFTPRMLV